MGFIKFLGTAGARFVMIRQLRYSAGIWLQYKNTNIIIDPGPGAIVRTNASRPKLDPGTLNGIILTHKHLDHANDINVMIEAMTEGGFKKRGTVYVPHDALGENGVIYPYLKEFPESIKCLSLGEHVINDIRFEAVIRNRHPVETYGMKFFIENQIISLVADTDYFEELIPTYKGSDVLVLNVVFHQEHHEIEHLCLKEALHIIDAVRPKKTIITHFGMSMLKAKPRELEKQVRLDTGLDVTLAHDGYSLELPLAEN